MKKMMIALFAAMAIPALADSITCEVKQVVRTANSVTTYTEEYTLHPNVTYMRVNYDISSQHWITKSLSHTLEINTVQYVENFIGENPMLVNGEFTSLRRENNKNTGRVVIYASVGKILNRQIHQLEVQAWDMGSIDGSVITFGEKTLQNLTCERAR